MEKDLVEGKAMNSVEYSAFVTRWLQGIKSELKYWDGYIATKGYGDIDDFNAYTAVKRPFVYDNIFSQKNTSFIDVGSGPFSTCGTCTTKTNLQFIAVDMMAPIYSAIKEKYNLQTEVTPQFTIVERLASQFGLEQFDIVHMSNSLDHTFDPMAGIWQLLGVCKVNGTVILEHHQNEAEAAAYDGLHQWNCTLQNGKFEIWNRETTIDVASELGDLVDITLERHAPMDTVIFKKKKTFKLETNPKDFIFEKILIEELERRILKEYFEL